MIKKEVGTIVNEINKADAESIDYILNAAIQRKRELHPDWELFYCAAPKDSVSSPEDMVRKAWEFEQEMKAKYG